MVIKLDAVNVSVTIILLVINGSVDSVSGKSAFLEMENDAHSVDYCENFARHLQRPFTLAIVSIQIQQLLPRDCMIVSEGASTMDIGRSMLPNYLPRHR